MRPKTIFFRTAFLLMGYISFAQYTDQINSNRPGYSIGAFAVGKNVLQFESGTELRRYNHTGYNNSTINGQVAFLSIRYGLLSEILEITYEGAFMFDKLVNNTTNNPIEKKRKGFLQNFLGVKVLVYDPFKKEQEINVYSWKANNGFKFRDLIPAVSVTVGANYDPLAPSPYSYGNLYQLLTNPLLFQHTGTSLAKEPPFSLRGTIATQTHFFSTWVFVSNLTYNRFLSDFPEFNYILTLTHTFDPIWSAYLEYQGIDGTFYKDSILRLGAAYLVTDDMQVEATIGANTKTTPSWISVNAGVSYRLDFHKDFQSAEELEAERMKKEEKNLKKTLRKNTKSEKKRVRKARRN